MQNPSRQAEPVDPMTQVLTEITRSGLLDHLADYPGHRTVSRDGDWLCHACGAGSILERAA